MPDDDKPLGDKASSPPSRWRSAETFKQLLGHMEEFRRTPEGQRFEAGEQVAEADLQAWLADQPGITMQRHGERVPEQWQGRVDGLSFQFRERGGEWAIELDLQKRPDGSVRRELIAEGTIADEEYGESPRQRAMFIVATIRGRLQCDTGADKLAYRVEWSPEDREFVGLVAEYPSLSWLAPTESEALRGIVELVQQITADGPDGGGGGPS
ncbi:hypothetical protein MN2019_24300 [Mycolicibacterium neoaurum]|uniref:hypothetical protein n=1 Tax=Mycolicibacterium neoaurum TaxID=1795 RepID=UPI001BCB7E13|nr:hypothetical protein [Mycolicibacterium neoaurum]QVI27291.1 hypothetical protein MN2019_24300 [Mycolicibacterium neoaurum]